MCRFIRYIVLYILVSCLVGWLLCNIDPDKTYTWYSGIWHGMFFISNFIRSWFTDALYKAESYTAAYNVFCGSLLAFLYSRFSLATMPEEDDFDVVYGIPSCFTKKCDEWNNNEK